MIENKFIPKYQPGQIIYAISFSNDSDRTDDHMDTVDDWSKDYARIYEVEIETIYITKTGIEYWLHDPGKPDASWGDSVIENHVSDNIDELLNYLKNKWKL